MKIIEIIPQLSSGGAERFVVDLCNEMVIRGHEVLLVALHKLDNYGFYTQELIPSVRVVSMEKRMGADLGLPFRITKLVRRENPDVVHTHLRGVVYSFLTMFPGITPKVRFFHTVHNAAPQEAGSGVSAAIRRWAFKHKWCTPVTISAESLRSFEEFYGHSAPMIFNGRNVPQDLQVSQTVQDEFAQYRLTPQTRVLICLARIEIVKRQTMLARIAKRMEEKGVDFTLLLVGSTRNTDLVNEIKAIGCNRLYILGERHNPLEYLKLADAFCLCSSYEGAPISLIEALGVGCVPVCTPVGSVVNIVKDEENGLVSEDISEESYSSKLESFFNIPDIKLKEMREDAIKSYSPFSMSECACKYIELFQS